MRTNKERTPSQISNEARPSAQQVIWKRRAKWGHTISPIHFTQPSTQLLQRNLVVFVRSQIHSYAYHLVSVRRHNQHVRSPIQGFFRCEGISFIPRVKQRSTFLQLSPQEHTNYITSHRHASIATRPNWRGRSDLPRQNANSAPRLQTRNQAYGNHPTTPMHATLRGNESYGHRL